MKTYELPKLPYAYDALEPIIDDRTMEIHHSKHHQAYIVNLNKALAGSPYGEMPLEQLFKLIHEVPPAIRNNAGGHYNHSLFWTLLSPPVYESLSPEQVEEFQKLPYAVFSQKEALERLPSGELAEAIDRDFGSYEEFKIRFAETATSRFGSGWAWLIWSNDEKKLKITSTANQDNPLMISQEIVSGEPIVGLDVWEHAYYLNYQNKRPEYIAGFWKLINWEATNTRYLSAR
jgi:Fe-Mn family superoxide dismutase